MASLQPRLATGASYVLVLLLLTLGLLSTPVAADGRGMLGLGKWLYKPFCAHACRGVIGSSKLTCDPKVAINGSTTSSSTDSHVHSKRHTHEVLNTEECYLQDAAFLRTLALCIAERCPRDDDIGVSVIEDYWAGHVATGSVGNWDLVPLMSYQDALRYAHEDVQEVGEDKMPLALAMSSIFLPVLLSLLRFLPGRPLWYSRLVNLLEKPLVGHRHRTPIVADLGIMPTRGQSLYLVYLITTQVFLSIFPLVWISPNSFAATRVEHYMMVIGDRSGVTCMANFVALFLFSSRNNALLWITNWSHATFLLIHRWIGYCLIFEVSIHSLLLFILHLNFYGDHPTESKMPYWIWGIVGTLALIFLWPASILPVRKKAYEFFLVFHQIFAALSLIATFLHIYYLFEYNWGYEIWVYIAGGIWFLDRVIRVARMVSNGYRTAAVSAIDNDAEYLRVDIDGIAAEGHVYLYFPTLSWKFWENHPYSVLSSFTGGTSAKAGDPVSRDQEKVSTTTDSISETSLDATIRPHTTLLVRTMDGFTKALTTRLLASTSRRITIPVIVESSYHANPAIRNLSHCSSLLCIAGGVGITAVLPLLKGFSGVHSRLEWGVRGESLVHALEPELTALTRGAGAAVVNTSIGQRLKIVDIVREELEKESDKGDLGIVVCGPNSMADDVRAVVAELGPKAKRGIVFVDEAFSW
ncbi:hypothetical protein FA13DRAFT_1774686 [Coprinellus micaceus]|uniref:Ferric oxidoreductase domain-containing protein n=1 Tax=Coprinellus micaceus TaxID=71717 RepID=A0A4Y7T8T6_COPMI|nr:hypothetical protein FA13DRAFT_1774686 [Coprinellus micaceus]